MLKKWRIWFRRELATPLSDLSKESSSNLERAKQLYLTNFANHVTMQKNGEFKEYCTYNVSKAIEYKWGLEVKDALIDEISEGRNLLQVVPLAHVNLPEHEIIAAFQKLTSSKLKTDIFETMLKLTPLFEPDIYKKIIGLFQSGSHHTET